MIRVICAWCNKPMHDKDDGADEDMVSHGICDDCKDEVLRESEVDFCGRYNIDLEVVTLAKMEYNAKRPYMHGGKKV